MSEKAVRELLTMIGESPQRPGLVETPQRVVKAWGFMCGGYAQKPEDVLKAFEDGAEDCDEMVIQKNIPLWSTCEHHMLPFFGVAHIAYIPKGRVLGLSKFARLVDVFARRLQVQERLTTQIADALMTHLQPLGVGVVLQCRHTCMEARGICKAGSVTTTSKLLGDFKSNGDVRNEFLSMVRNGE
jgi:GTP cyclohydrolase IA